MKTLLLTLLLLQAVLPQQNGPSVKGKLNVAAGQTITSLEFDLIGGDLATRRSRVNVASDGSFEVSGLATGTYEVYLMGRVVGAFAFKGTEITIRTIALQTPRPEYRLVRGRVSGTIPTGQLSTSLEFDLLGGNPATRRTQVNLAPDGSFDVLDLTPGTYEVYLFGRVVSTFQLADRDIAGLAFGPR